ncbi:MAG: hypothetical protein IPN89_09120 [Saprospiraceae bacterium]|nr:hypothetical protein [Saprospiraceae bacterium]
MPCPGPGAPCTLNCLGDFNVSLSGCNPFTIPDKIDLAWLTGNCPRVLLPLSSGFVGAFGDLVDYNFIVPGFGNPYDGNADCITTNFPSSLTIQSATGSDCFWNITSASFVVPQDGQISFNWSSTNADPGWDYFGYHVGTPANPNSLDAVNAIFGGTSVSSTTFGVGASENGVINGVAVTAGSVLTFYAIANGGVDPIIATISNLQFSEWSCPEVVQLQGPTPGTEVGQGIYNMKFVGVDAYGNELGKCAYQITVTAVQPNLTCNDHLNISVNETCRIALVPDMLLENYEALGPCQDGDFIIKVWPFGDASKATGNVNGVATAYPKGTHTYEITHPYGNKCWGTFTVEDKLAPRIDCGPVRNIQCYEVDALVAEDVTKKASPSTARFAPSWADNCGMVTAEFTTHKLLDGCNGGNVLRKWIVTDMSGNTAYCEQWFAVNTVVEWSCPTSLVVLGCKDAVTPEAIAASRGVAAGFPYFASPAGNTPIHGVCNYYTTYSDVEIDACGAHCHGNRKVIRSWQILDWCNGTVTPCQQIIKAIDTEAPTFIVKDTIISTAPWYCEGDFYVPNPWELHDNCDINPTWSVKSSVVGVQIVPALLNGTPHPVYKYRAIGVPKGTSHLKYTATDCCGNEVTIVSNVTVVDKTPPVPVAKRDIVIGLVPGYDANGVPDGTAKLYSESIDNGSYDNCSAARLEIRRVNKGVKSDNVTTDAPSCGNLGNGIPRWNNNITFNNRLAANLGNNMPYNTNDTDGGLFVKFCCEDLTSAGADFDGDGTLDVGYHMVIMRVWDDGNMDGTIGNAGDNWNDTWANVKVECKVPPVITCPADATIHCDWAIEKFVSSSATKSVVGVDFKKTGLPEAYGVCTNPAIEFRDREVTDQCGIGFIERTFVIKEKDLTRTCVQIITILPSTSAQPWVTNFPGDWDNVEQIGCDEPTAAQIKAKGPTNVGGPCDVIGVSTKMWLFNFEDGVCKKWKVEYKYVNWCTNEERGPFYKYFMYSDEVAPVVTCRDTMYAVGVNCELSGLQLTKKATDTGGCIDNGWLKWTVIVDLWADGSNDIEYTSFIAPNNDVSNMRNGNFGAIRDDNENGIPDVYLAPTANGAAIPANSIILPTIAGKMSNHKVAWKVTDGCHNFTTCHESFMVADKKAPTPVCIPLSTALMQDPDGSGPLLPMVELWAIDFMNKSYDNCTDASDLLYTFDDWAPRIADTVIQTRLVNVDKAHYFNSKGQAVAAYPARPTNSVEKAAEAAYLAGNLQLWIPENRSSAKVWVAGDIAPGVKKTVDVHVTVWDKKFNHDYCWTTLDLIYNGTTNVGSRISGSVVTASNQPVNNVAVTIDANITEYPKTVSTAVAGTYEMEVPVGMNYQITASKGGDYLNGVSTLDLVLIQRHILGIQTLDNRYKLIAADANNDGAVTASDLIELRKLILGITNELPKNASWRFPVTAQSMDATNPFPFVEQIAISQLLTNMSNQNFVAVKIGDVNGNVSTNVSNPCVEGRSNRNVVMAVAEHTVAAG